MLMLMISNVGSHLLQQHIISCVTVNN